MPKQENRILYLTTPLGPDVLALGSFTGSEGMSRLFTYDLQMVSESGDIAAKDIVGKNITWKVQYKDGPPRFFNGYVSRFSASSVSPRGLRAYRAQAVPWLWFLTRTANCRIFQKKTAPEIIQKMIADLGFSSACKVELNSTYAKRDFCVQYRETGFNFLCRLMEEEGMFFFFQHEDGQHTMVLADRKTSYFNAPVKEPEIDSWAHHFEFRVGKWTRTDYNFETPSTDLTTSTNTILDLPDIDKYEMFDYPGGYQVKADGTAGTKVRMEEDELPNEVAQGSSECPALAPAGRFTLGNHSAKAEGGKDYIITSVKHKAADTDFESSGNAASYANTFECIPDSVVYRPARVTPKPVIAGPQTAVVVGKAGEEIFTDKYGRVKVQFFWDREGKKDENSSCWIRVAQNWAGKNWGIVFNPRIGQEVVVEFLEGDPDRPLITGRVYNAEQMPPYDLPTNQTQSGIKSRSSLKGTTENFNEIRFEDKKGKEEIFVQAEKDFNRVVENNDTLKVGSSKSDDGSQTIEIYKDRTETVKTGNETITIEQGNRAVTVSQGNDSLTISQGNRAVTISQGNDTLTIKMGNQTTKINMGSSSTEAMQSIELKVGQSSIKLDPSGVTIQGANITINASAIATVQGALVKINS